MYKLNINKEILKEIKPKLDKCDEILIAVSFITSGGFETLFGKDAFEKNIKVITTLDQYITQPKILNEFLKNDNIIKIFDESSSGQSFHSKFIIGKVNGEVSVSIVGSMNLTEKSINEKFETVHIEYGNDNDELVNQFNNLLDMANELDYEILENYEEKYSRKQFLFSEIDAINKKISIAPRGMQIGVLDELKKLRNSNEDMALLYSATGTGKSYLSAFDMKARGFKKALFIVHSRLIIRNAKRDYSNVFLDKKTMELHSWNGALIKNCDVVFTTQLTAKTFLETDSNFLKQFDYFVFDEAHKMGARNIQGELFKIISKLDSPKFILGMTATPWRSDEPNYLFKSFKHNVVGNINLEKALKEKMICNFKYKAIGATDVDFSVDKLKRDDTEKLLDKFMLALEETKTWDGTKVKGIIFTANISEANELSSILNEKYSNYKSQPMHSKLSELEDESIIHDADVLIKMLEDEKDDLNFIVTVDMFNEGVDIPRINTIGMFRFTKSSIIYAQQIGRGLRLEDGEKYLNIIDLVGNHNESYQRIVALSGRDIESPRQTIERLLTSDYDIDDVSKEEILSKICKNTKFRTYFKKKLSAGFVSNKFQPKISELQEYLGEDMGIIINSFRDSREYSFENSEPWILNYKKIFGEDFSSISKKEMGLIEMFSWLPLTATTSKEKKKIFKLLNGEQVKIDDKWKTYFYKPRNKWSFVKGEYSEFFKEAGELVSFNRTLITNEKTNELLCEISEAINSVIEQNNVMINSKWYSKQEISFMAGKAKRVQSSIIKKSKKEYYITNSIDLEKNKTQYENKAIDNSNYIISSNNQKKYKNPDEIKYQNFMGRSIFHQNDMYLYVGEHDELSKREDVDREFPTYKFKSKNKISDEDLLMLMLGIIPIKDYRSKFNFAKDY